MSDEDPKGDRRFTSILAFMDDGPEGLLYRLDYLPRREFDRIKDAGQSAALFTKSPALRMGKLFNNLLHAMTVDDHVRREVEHLAHVAAMVRSQGSEADAARYGESRMLDALRIEGNLITPVPKSMWILNPAKLHKPEDEQET